MQVLEGLYNLRWLAAHVRWGLIIHVPPDGSTLGSPQSKDRSYIHSELFTQNKRQATTDRRKLEEKGGKHCRQTEEEWQKALAEVTSTY